MLTLRILSRCASIGLMLAGLVLVTDGMARAQLERAVQGDSARIGFKSLPLRVAQAVAH